MLRICNYNVRDLHVIIADSEGRTPLHWAVDRGHLNVVELLINRNADVNAQVVTPLSSWNLFKFSFSSPIKLLSVYSLYLT